MGLGIQPDGHAHPKQQTIRADRKRHAHPGEQLQLFCGMRTKDCFLIGRAHCISVEPIAFLVGATRLMFNNDSRVLKPSVDDDFARNDGFANAGAMYRFWLHEHGLGRFSGVLIKWEPLR